MKLWFSAPELADLADKGELSGIPSTKMGMAKLIERGDWHRYSALVRRREGRVGGGFEYHIEQLPLATRLAYIARQFDFDPKTIKRELGDDGLTQKARDLRDAKVFVVKMADAFKKQVGLASHASDRTFSDLFNSGSIAVPEWVKGCVKSLSRRTLVNYREAIADDANRLAADPSQSRKGTGLLETANGGELHIAIMAWLSKPGMSAKNIRKQCRHDFGDTIVDRHGEVKPMPPLRTFQHYIATLRSTHKVALTKLTDPDKYRSHFRLAGVGAYRHITEPNQLWQIDASPVDALCIDGRHSIYICNDIATRRIVITLSRTPRASAVGLMTRKALLQLGVPKLIVTDNGSDFVAKETQRLFDHLGIDTHQSDAYSPEQKGHVERVIGTFQRDMAPQLPGYIGRNVAQRKAIESRNAFAKRLGQTEKETFEVSLTAAQLQHYIDEWVEFTYSQSPHEGLNKRTPAEVAAASSEVIRRVDERALDVLLAPVAGSGGIRVTTKRGIRIDGFYYLTGRILPNTPVLVRMDPMDAGRVLAFSQNGTEFLSDAICAELRGINPTSLVKAAREQQAELIEATLKPVRAHLRKSAKGPALIQRALEVDKRDCAARQAANANVIQLPKREERHTTAHIEAALDAATEPKAVTRPLTPAEAAMQRRLIDAMTSDDVADLAQRADVTIEETLAARRAELTAHLPPEVVALPETPKQRYRRAIIAMRAAEAGTAEGDVYDGIWLARYQQSAEFKAHAKLHADFGDAYLS